MWTREQEHTNVSVKKVFFLLFCAAGTVMTPNYVRSLGISLSPWCDCSSSGNSKPDCERFSEYFTKNRCLREFTHFQPCLVLYCMSCVVFTWQIMDQYVMVYHVFAFRQNFCYFECGVSNDFLSSSFISFSCIYIFKLQNKIVLTYFY